MSPKATTFNFKGYTIASKTREIFFKYQISFKNQGPLDFTETIRLPKQSNLLSEKELKNFLEPLHLILGVSYYKLYCPGEITLPFSLSEEQAEFWNTVYRKGLGEFLYRNNLDPKIIAKFPFKKVTAKPISVAVKDQALLGIGGGKDSIVAAELLRKEIPVTAFLVETQRADTISENVIAAIGYPSLKIERVLDPKIFLQHEGAYNGHVPISAIFAFLGLLSSALYGYRYVIVGNEHSSNFGNITWKGETINHQWSKSAEFEALLQEYTRKYITPDITYFSLLRQFYEIRIAKLFSKQQKYFPLFSSCNRNFKVHKERQETLWCGECPKCAFVFLLLAPFTPKKTLVGIFGKNLLADETLVPLFGDILGFGTMKPFDCVGTFEESQAALYLARRDYANEIVTTTFLSNIKNPEMLVQEVMKTTHAPTLPTPFKFLGIETVAIIGYGREGKVTEKYLKQKYPKLKIGILDEARDKHYLKKQSAYDLAIKTPGIPKRLITIPYTTATNIFFSQNKNITIGITGTKGKSTTTSLVYEILNAGGKKVRLLGNIGNPMLEVLLKKPNPKEIFVLELSSYMLEDIERSPNVALLLNLFPEHMDYHGSLEAYYQAKKNIFKFQKQGDIAFLPPFKAKIPVSKKEIPLLGAHNENNIRAAIAVAKYFKVSDSAIKKAIKNFKPLPHRLELVGTYSGITFYDDAISTTPESTIEAIKTLTGVHTIFLGGTDRGYDFRELEKTLRKHNVKNVVLFPDSGNRILKSEKGFTVLKTASMKEAVQFAYKYTKKGSICLLSTASPSYSVWKNFEEKGDIFKKEILKYSKAN
jgi:UDP-N-acetylmuramoylalanine--D-glutamate ligase